MADRPSPTHADLAEIRAAIAALDRRIAALEREPAASPAADDVTVEATADDASPQGRSTGALLSLAGRAFLALGGAFVLRAMTESGLVGPTTGVWLGLTYAVAWLVAAERAGGGASGVVNGWLGLSIGLPLVLEAAGRFKLLSVGAGVGALTLVAGLALVVAWRRRLPSLAAGAVAGGALVTLALGFATGTLLPYSAVTVLLSVVALWVTHHRGWRWIAWVSAGAADLVVLLAALRACVRPPPESPFGTEVVLAGFGAVYLGSFVMRTLLHERTVRLFEVVQTGVVMVVGLGGAIVVARVNGLGLAAVGLPAAIAGVALYAQRFASRPAGIRRRPPTASPPSALCTGRPFWCRRPRCPT
jgi:hypothetical protein